MAIGPTYFDPNIRGTRLTLYASARSIYTRARPANYEGNTETLSVRYPLYSLASRWGGGRRRRPPGLGDPRGFRGNAVRLVDLPGTPGVRRAPYAVPLHAASPSTRTPARSLRTGGDVIQRRDGRLPRRRSRGSSTCCRPFRRAQLTARCSWPQCAPRRRAALGAVPALRDVHARATSCSATSTPSTCARTGASGRRCAVRVAYGLPALGRRPSLACRMSAAAPAGPWRRSAPTARRRSRPRDAPVRRSGAHRSVRGRRASSWRRRSSGRVVRRRGRRRRPTPCGPTPPARVFVLGGDTGLRGYAIGEFLGTSGRHRPRRAAHAARRACSRSASAGSLFYDVGNAADRSIRCTPTTTSASACAG